MTSTFTPTFDASPQQAAYFDALIHTKGHIMLKAYAGCGKTTTLEKGLHYVSGDVFLGAYNVPIKDELIRRVAAIQRSLSCNVTVKTIHGAGWGAINKGRRKEQWIQTNEYKVPHLIEDLAERTKNDKYLIYDRFLTRLVALAKLSGMGALIEDVDEQWIELVDYYGVADQLPEDAYNDEGDVPDSLFDILIGMSRTVLAASTEMCNPQRMDLQGQEMDFDDQLYIPIIRNLYLPKYDYVFIDEAQDCSAIRQEIAVRMLKPNGRLVFCGDEFQNIYGFTGCMHDEMQTLRDRLDAEVLPLSVTYRCPKVVVRIANEWVPDLEAHPSAPEGVYRSVYLEPPACSSCFGSGKAESATVTDGERLCPKCNGTGLDGPGFWSEAAGLGPESVILCRNNKPLVELAYQLLRKGIPCQIAGRDFASGLISLCKRWKVRTLDKLEERLTEYKAKEAAKWRKQKNDARAAAVEDKVDTLLVLLDAVRSSGKDRVVDLIDKIDSMFKRKDDAEGPRVLTLSSVHKAKGREWDRVYILGRDRYMPSKWARKPHEIQAEKNIMYVAVTRAKRELVDVIVPAVTRRTA